MGFFMCVHFRATKDRYLCRCRSASFFRRIRTAQSGQYLARLDFGVNTAPHAVQRFSLSRLLLISAYRAASGAFSWVFLYAFRSLFWRGLDNLSRLPADHAGKALLWLAFHHPKCVDRRRFVKFPRNYLTLLTTALLRIILYLSI